MNWKAILIISGALQCAGREAEAVGAESKTANWSTWSSCSATCGKGWKWRTRICQTGDNQCRKTMKQSRHCFLEFCPSYLSWPRIHFSGILVADVSTTNNNRCAYENEEFSAADLSKEAIGLQEKVGTHDWYKFVARIWNPDGTNHLYFVNTFVTSFCSAPKTCSTSASIVGLKVIETVPGVMVVLDVDWQKGTEIWGLKIRIPGVLEGDFSVTSRPIECTRVDHIAPGSSDYYVSAMGRYKGKLLNVTWQDSYYQSLFKNAKELSMAFVIDIYNELSTAGRITATIGPTSPDEPKQSLANRFLQVTGKSKTRCPAPFHVHYKKHTLTIDLSYSVQGRQNGSIYASDLGKWDLALLLSKKIYCKYFKKEAVCMKKGNETSFLRRWITSGGELTKRIGSDTEWYTTYGGVMDISLSHLDATTLKLMKNNRIAIVDSDNKAYMQEFPGGITTGFMNNAVLRFNVGESETVYPFVSSYGRPVKNAQVNIHLMKDANAVTNCGRPSCNTTMGVPSDALRISSDHHFTLTNISGLAAITLEAKKDPGKIRGCDLDGQIYPLQLYTRYRKGKRVITYANNGSSGSGLPADYKEKGFEFAAHLYNSIPIKTCPTWHDVKEIFVQYYNLYPVMWKSGVIDLHSYNAVRKKARILMVSMFETSFFSSRYMPISRDLSNSKKMLIWNWMKCGMKRTERISVAQTDANVCTERYIDDGVRDVRRLLHKAVMLELSTIPPYVTAWLSLKTEYGRNMEIAHIIKTIFNEEMLHMTLAGNTLNAVGGVVNMTDDTKLPMYPTILASGDTYQLCADMQIGLGPFSIGLIQDVFSKIEKPSDFESRQLVYTLAEIWKNIPSADSVSHARDEKISKNMQHVVSEAKKLGKIRFPNSDVNDGIKKWTSLREFADTVIKHVQDLQEKSVGEFYTLIALRLTSLESCTRIKYLKNLDTGEEKDGEHYRKTIFTGNPMRQLNISHWYQQSEDSFLHVMKNMGEKVEDITRCAKNPVGAKFTRPSLFEVTDLKTALEAIVEIVYQGEGGSECSPFVTEPEIYASGEGRDRKKEVSHYYRFQEIVNGRKLIKIPTPPPWVEWNCLNVSHPEFCPSLTKSGESYCFAGDAITFYDDGVWPLIFNPKDGHYVKGSKADRLHHQFNLLYTRLLFCIQEAFGGTPSNMRNCMSLMYDMTIIGKRLVQTPLQQNRDNEKKEMQTEKKHGTPTWLFVREKPFRAGFPLQV